uniref:G-protein coupled receptors family 1 profile domain-containing protein n=1 Tax=viral metagenome TaxID=1070528 RepID=A0A6C0DF08_9ZZZZ
MNYTFVTLCESLYLFYMYFLFKTKYTFNTALLDKQIQKIGPFFVHNTGSKENKICLFGKMMAIIAIILAWIRLHFLDNPKVISYSLAFSSICIILAFLMNTNALVYIIPLIIIEIYIVYSLHKKQKKNQDY